MVPNQPNPKFLKTYWYGLILKIQQSVKPCLPPSSDGPEAWACWLSISSWMALLMSTQESIKNTKQIVWKCTQAFQFYSNIVINQIIYLCTSFVQCTFIQRFTLHTIRVFVSMFSCVFPCNIKAFMSQKWKNRQEHLILWSIGILDEFL